MFRKHTLPAILICAALPAASETIVVTSNADIGAGTLRAALFSAAASEQPSTIVLKLAGDILINDTLTYAGRSPLSVTGAGNGIKSDQNVTLLAVTNGADLSLTDLNFEGPGGFDIGARDEGLAGKGVFIAVSKGQTETVSLTLNKVRVSGVAGHGIHVSDCDLADDCGSGGGGAGSGSDASISVDLRDVTISDVGNGSFDADGLRVDERGVGDITARIVSSRFTGVGADGVELDEGQDGNVIVEVSDTVFDGNGIYCDPDVLNAFVPDPDEAEFEKGAQAKGDILNLVAQAPDTTCIESEIEYYADGSVKTYEFGIDVDDGFDIDEAGQGSIVATLDKVEVRDNLDEGLDFDEEDAGSIILRLDDSILKGNSDDGVKMSEEDAGDVLATLSGVFALSNGGKGAVFEEEDGGDATIAVLFSTTRDNDDGDETGIEVDEDDAGRGTLMLHQSIIADGIDADGIELR